MSKYYDNIPDKGYLTGQQIKECVDRDIEGRPEVISQKEITEQERIIQQLEIINSLISLLKEETSIGNSDFENCLNKLEQLNSDNMPTKRLVNDLKNSIKRIEKGEIISFKFESGLEFLGEMPKQAMIAYLKNEISQISDSKENTVFYTSEEMNVSPKNLLK